jgi:hypothetical protein
MGVTTQKYGVLVSLGPKLAIFGITVGVPTVLSENLSFFKTYKNSYTGPLCTTDPQYGDHDQDKLSFNQFIP